MTFFQSIFFMMGLVYESPGFLVQKKQTNNNYRLILHTHTKKNVKFMVSRLKFF